VAAIDDVTLVAQPSTVDTLVASAVDAGVAPDGFTWEAVPR